MLKIHHIGYAVNNMEEAISAFLPLGYELEKAPQYDTDRDMYIAFLHHKYNETVELIQPDHEKDTTISKLLKRTGPSPYHICYRTDNLEESIALLKDIGSGYYPVSKIERAVTIAPNARVIFLYNGAIGLIELVEVA